MKKTAVSMLMQALVLATTCACALPPSRYYGEAIDGRVVDATTNVPLSGVSILAQWELEGGVEGHVFGLVHVADAVTDNGGAFHIANWGPTTRPAEGFLDTADPILFFFKSGYRPKVVSNLGPYAMRSRIELTTRNSAWNGKTISLEPYLGSPERYGEVIVPSIGAATTFLREACWWKRAPRFMRAIDIEMRRQQEAGNAAGAAFQIKRLMQNGRCAPFDDFLKEFEAAK